MALKLGERLLVQTMANAWTALALGLAA